MSGRYYTKNILFSNDYLNLMKKYILQSVYFESYGNIHNMKFYFGTEKKKLHTSNDKQNKSSKLSLHEIQKNVYKSVFLFELSKLGKYEALYNTLFFNLFDTKFTYLNRLEIKQKMVHISLFYTLQRVLFSLRKFIQIFRIKYKSRNYNSQSLIMDDFKPDESIYKLYDFKNINVKSETSITCYNFNTSDLYNIVEKNIVSYDSFLVYDNIDLKNPYNNISFTYCQLWNIYFFLRDKSLKSIPIFSLYFTCNFDKSLFILKYDFVLRNHIIDDYYKSISSAVKLSIFRKILDEYYPIQFDHHRLQVDTLLEFYQEKRGLVYDYLMYKYSYNINLSTYHLSQIKRVLNKTYDKNPLMGRRIRIIDHNGKRTFTVNNGNGVY